ncbi:UNVERIFIED_CONTAM: hypothetical protein O8I53_13675 [Campylobacter lari]
MAVAHDYTHLVSLKFNETVLISETSKRTGISTFNRVKKFDMSQRFGGYEVLEKFQFKKEANKLKFINYLANYKTLKNKSISFDEDICLESTTFYKFKDIVIKAKTPFKIALKKAQRLNFDDEINKVIMNIQNEK